MGNIGVTPYEATAFDIVSMLIHSRIPTPLIVPTCLDEFIDWTDEATATSTRLIREQGLHVVGEEPVQFKPLIRVRCTRSNKGGAECVTQRDIDDFPNGCNFELSAYYEQNILIHVERAKRMNRGDAENVIYSLSGLDFCIYLKLLRRLAHLTELGSPQEDDGMDDKAVHECRICMDRPQDTVLPCLHGVCSTCEQKWVEKKMDCPFCRKRYTNRRRRKREQWQMESWEQGDYDKDMVALEEQIKAFWEERACGPLAVNENEDFARLERSVTETIVDNEFVLLD